MSDHFSEDDEEDDLGYDDDNNEAPENEDCKVQRKLHLFQSASIQQSIKRLWDLLPKDQQGQLVMEGYVELNLRLQKALTQEFVLERAIDSAIGDWGEDVREGQRSMTADEFAMFLFELCSLWCGPSVSLLVYLLFLNASFIAVTDARGAHTVGLRPLAAVERLPQPFFDLLSIQGWAKQPEDNGGLNEEQALSAWLLRNLSPENEHATRLQVQRQCFQVTHDVRSVMLFPEGPSGDANVLDLVKIAHKKLANISPIEAEALSKSVAAMTGTVLPLKCKPGMKTAPSTRASSQPAGRRGENSLGKMLALGDWEPRRTAATSSISNKPPPRGRAYDTQLSKNTGRGLVLAGQAALASMLAGSDTSPPLNDGQVADTDALQDISFQESLGHLHPTSSQGTLQQQVSVETSVPVIRGANSPTSMQTLPVIRGANSPTSMLTPSDQVDKAAILAASTAAAGATQPGRISTFSRQVTPSAPTPIAANMLAQVDNAKGHDQQQQLVNSDGTVARQLQNAVGFLVDTPAAVPYKLPRHPTHLYQQQADPLIKMLPQSIVHDVNKWQDSNALVPAPFERVLRRLPPEIRPSSAGPTGGPLHHPNEPIWFEMVHRLHGILKRQGRRAERRRKRRLRSKLFRGRTRHAPTKRDEGKELREYLDHHKAEVQSVPLQQQATGAGVREPGEFLGKVHETYLMHRERAESRPFRVRGTGTHFAGKKGVGEMIRHKQAVVRPVYVPPPPSSMAGR
jgi:hypothetical protein